MDDANYASLGSVSMFDAIRNQSVATSIQTHQTAKSQKAIQKQQSGEKRVRNNINTLKPVVIKTEKVAADPTVVNTTKKKSKAVQASSVRTKAKVAAEATPKQNPIQPTANKKKLILL